MDGDRDRRGRGEEGARVVWRETAGDIWTKFGIEVPQHTRKVTGYVAMWWAWHGRGRLCSITLTFSFHSVSFWCGQRRVLQLVLYKYVEGIAKIDVNAHVIPSQTSLRGHSKKLYKKRLKKDVKKYSFPDRAIDKWNCSTYHAHHITCNLPGGVGNLHEKFGQNLSSDCQGQ